MLFCKTTKQAFIISALVILLCLVSLAGSTYALFTNDLKDGTIGIITTSGDVSVDIVDSEGKESLKGKTLQFMTTGEAREILFEPGATFYTQGFKVKNTGTVSINFRVDVNYSKDFTEKNIAEFEEAFEVWIATDYQDPDTRKRSGEFVGSLEWNADKPAVSEETYYLIVKMKKTADNTFRGATYDGIGITVYAIQGNVTIQE